MKNFIQHGRTLTVPAPTGGVVSGAVVIIGALVAIANADAAEGEDVALETAGVFELPKTSAQAWTVGAKIYWDATNAVATTTSSGNTLMGIAAAAAANPSATGLVKIGPTL
jgi:predicted RecA/RadA family phage recombinase